MKIQLGGRAPATWSKKLVGRLKNKAYRNSYVASHVRHWLAFQVRALREQRGWSQADLSKLTDKPQSNISRIEDPSYGRLTLQTLLELAKAFDVALEVKFVDYRSFLIGSREVGPSALEVQSFDASSLASDPWAGVTTSTWASQPASLLTGPSGVFFTEADFVPPPRQIPRLPAPAVVGTYDHYTRRLDDRRIAP